MNLIPCQKLTVRPTVLQMLRGSPRRGKPRAKDLDETMIPRRSFPARPPAEQRTSEGMVGPLAVVRPWYIDERFEHWDNAGRIEEAALARGEAIRRGAQHGVERGSPGLCVGADCEALLEASHVSI